MVPAVFTAFAVAAVSLNTSSAFACAEKPPNSFLGSPMETESTPVFPSLSTSFLMSTSPTFARVVTPLSPWSPMEALTVGLMMETAAPRPKASTFPSVTPIR